MERKIKPIKPEELTKKKEDFIPDKVIEVFNELIAEKWDGESSFFYQKEVVKRILK